MSALKSNTFNSHSYIVLVIKKVFKSNGFLLL